MNNGEMKKKILIVEDDIDQLEHRKASFISKGFEVITAENGKEAWEKFNSEKPDAAIIDLILEEYDSGFILCNRIKNNNKGKNIPVFILTSAPYLTGYKFSTSTEEEKEWLCCDEILNKPASVDEIIMKLESYFMVNN